MSKHADINGLFEQAMADNLHVRSTSQAIDSLLNSRRKTIDYEAYYQRNYVWSNDKASFFIESILLGVEIPPLIFFVHAHDRKTLEVIDGRQRFETIKRFKEGQFSLRKNGLAKLNDLAGKKYADFNGDLEQYQRAFNNTTLRIIEFSTKNPHEDHDTLLKLEDKIKKEIFRRYNTGITPLKTIEVKNARHQDDTFTALMEKSIKENKAGWVDSFKRLFINIKPGNISDGQVMDRLRELIVLEYFPINIYASTSGRGDVVDRLFYEYIEADQSEGSLSAEQQEKLEKLIGKTQLLDNLYQSVAINEWFIYQAVFWAMSVLDVNEVDVQRCFDQELIEMLSQTIKNNVTLFTGSSKSFSATTRERFKLIADFFEMTTGISFTEHLKSPLDHRADNQDKNENDFNEQRLARPDAETTTVEELILKMINNEYLLRPPYQRREVINEKKASGIIESILLGIPLPTLFIYRRKNGVAEVVDGQQRLLSIIGFIGDAKDELLDDNEPKTELEPKKNNFQLAKTLPILKNHSDNSFADLGESDKDKIWDFELSLVYIDEETNPHFDPIDLFIRLNDKSYDIKDPSFELWNSAAERTIIDPIKDLTEAHRGWFYYRKNDTRMAQEELLMAFVYLGCESEGSTAIDFLDPVQTYQIEGGYLTFRVENAKIDHWLKTAEGESDEALSKRNEIHTCIGMTKDFIAKVEALLGPALENEIKAKKFDDLIGLSTRARNQRAFYLLWYLLVRIQLDYIQDHQQSLFEAVQRFIQDHKRLDIQSKDDIKKVFFDLISDFWKRHG